MIKTNLAAVMALALFALGTEAWAQSSYYTNTTSYFAPSRQALRRRSTGFAGLEHGKRTLPVRFVIVRHFTLDLTFPVKTLPCFTPTLFFS